ncbi:THAP domain-containing protein 11 [Spea bombifrons]|uniref:THAP domain-containing protein 11 n=1 Tax=Spea bombifrons TaxID=233779 RepID=UPI00234B82AB|nr:THAP domain-containing protein 11 [Spea bombifrons]
MPGFTCCVPGCYSNSHRDKGLHFYTFPKDPELRRLWLKNVSRAGVTGCFNTFQPTNGHRVCSLHFHGGRKSYSIKVPTIFPLRGVNERKVRRSNAGDRGKKRQQPHYSSSATTVLVTGLPGQDEQEVLELTAGSAEMVLLGATAGMGATMSGVGASAVMGDAMDAMGAAQGGGGTVAAEPNPVNLTVKLDAGEGLGTHFSSPNPQDSHQQIQVVVVGEETYPIPDCCPSPLFTDHSYSMSSGTTTEELLRKLNEQRDIIALMEVKMKEMKSNIRHLRITEVKLREEIRQKDKVLSMAAAKKKTEGHL